MKLFTTALLALSLACGPSANDEAMSQRLASDFELYNQAYFGSQLPATAVHFEEPWDQDHKKHLMGALWHMGAGQHLIQISPYYAPDPKEANLTLLHEMCHLDTGEHEHTSRWQACMHRLASEGAMDNLW